MKVNIGLSGKSIEGTVSILEVVLSSEYVLYTKTRNYHWNVVGTSFQELHKFFESQYDELDVIIDDVAERIRALGSYSPGSAKFFLEKSILSEEEKVGLKSEKMLENLLKDHEAIVVYLRDSIEKVTDKMKDAGTADFLTGLLENHEKMSWMLRSYLS